MRVLLTLVEINNDNLGIRFMLLGTESSFHFSCNPVSLLTVAPSSFLILVSSSSLAFVSVLISVCKFYNLFLASFLSQISIQVSIYVQS